MSLFLLEFDGTARHHVGESVISDDAHAAAARAARDAVQRRMLDQSARTDVVLLTVPSLEVVRQTHGFFFLTLHQQWERLLASAARLARNSRS